MENSINMVNLNTEKIYSVFVHHHLALNPISWFNWAVRFFSKSYWNHSAVLVYEDGVWLIYEATAKGVFCEEFLAWKLKRKKEIEVHPAVVNEGDPSMVRFKLKSHLGKRYDFLGTTIHQLVWIKFKVWIGLTQEAALKRLFCSEYHANAFGYTDCYQYSPADLYKLHQS